MASISITDTGTPIVPAIPPTRGNHRLESGDHMDRATFHQRYRARPPEFRAELLDGVVFVSSPTSPDHGFPHGIIGGALWFYASQTPGSRYYEPQGAIEGAFRSQAFPGLWLDEAAMRSGDSAGVLATLQRGLATPEHAEFVKRLQAARP